MCGAWMYYHSENGYCDECSSSRLTTSSKVGRCNGSCVCCSMQLLETKKRNEKSHTHFLPNPSYHEYSYPEYSVGTEIVGSIKHCIELNNKKTSMSGGNNECANSSVLERFAIAVLPEPDKSFRKAGITNGDGILTSQGSAVLLTWLLKKHGKEFNDEVVSELLKKDK